MIKYEGTPVKLGGQEYIIPALTLRQVRVEAKPFLEKIRAGGMDADTLDSGASVIHMALKRNYPALTRNELDDVLDLKNFKELIQIVMGISGLVAKPGE